MQIIFEIFNALFFAPLVNLLVLLIQTLQSAGIPGAPGFAIILVTIFIRLLIWPLMSTQLKSMKKLADLKPLLDALKQKHKGDNQALTAATMALYKEQGVNPAGGCLPILLQFPILIALYQSVIAFFSGDVGLQKINDLIYTQAWRLDTPPDPNFFGLNLAIRPSEFINGAWFLLAIPFLTAGLQFIQSKMMAPQPVKKYPSDSPKEKKEKEGVEDSMQAIQSQMLYLMPVMIGFFAFQFPIALALYWNTLTIFSIFQQYLIAGWGGLQPWLDKIKR